MPQTVPPPPLTLVLLVDGLGSRYLAPYGCTWIDTPSLNRLAARSIVFENAIADSNQAADAVASFLAGRPAVISGNPSAQPAVSPLPEIRQRARCLLMSDDPACLPVDLPDAWFDEVLALPDVAAWAETAESTTHLADTHLAHCFARIISELSEQDLPLLAVIHLASLTRVWDAPLEMRARFCEEDDPEPEPWVVPPRRLGRFPDPDPDEILGITRALAAQIECFDTCLGLLLDELKAQQLDEATLLTVCGLRGFPVGHHGEVLPANSLLSEVIDVALLVGLPNAEEPASRRDHGLIQPSEVLSGIAEWMSGGSTMTTGRVGPSVAILGNENIRAIRTPAWLLIETEDQNRLFVKPDDRWDVNPIQDRCRDITDALSEARVKYLNFLVHGAAASRPQLASELLERFD